MTNEYNEELEKIAGMVRGAKEEGNWGELEIGIPIDEVINLEYDSNVLGSDRDLFQCVLGLELNPSELEQEDQARLRMAFLYACHAINDLKIDINEAIWRKYFINEATFAIPLAISVNEINRTALSDEVPYQEGIFDEVNSASRQSEITLGLRRVAYRNASELFRNAEFPFGERNVGIIQLVLRDWLLRTGKPFSIDEMKGRLMNEVCELSKARKSIYFREEERWDRAYEACDVMIYIMHTFTIYGKNIADVLK